jgi:hypothetical protein
MPGMNSLNDLQVRAIDLKFPKGNLQVFLDDGRVILIPLDWYPRLANASKKSLLHFEWIGKGVGIHWPELDEDLSVEGFLKAQKAPKNQFKKSKLLINGLRKKNSLGQKKRKFASV